MCIQSFYCFLGIWISTPFFFLQCRFLQWNCSRRTHVCEGLLSQSSSLAYVLSSSFCHVGCGVSFLWSMFEAKVSHIEACDNFESCRVTACGFCNEIELKRSTFFNRTPQLQRIWELKGSELQSTLCCLGFVFLSGSFCASIMFSILLHWTWNVGFCFLSTVSSKLFWISCHNPWKNSSNCSHRQTTCILCFSYCLGTSVGCVCWQASHGAGEYRCDLVLAHVRKAILPSHDCSRFWESLCVNRFDLCTISWLKIRSEFVPKCPRGSVVMYCFYNICHGCYSCYVVICIMSDSNS